MTRLIEILLYRLKPGTGGVFFDIMQNISVPLHVQNGIDVIWHGQSLHDPDAYGLIRGFADMTTLDAVQSAFYASTAWRSGPREAIIARIETATKIIIPMNADAVKGLREQGYHAFPTER
ncbi:NIPSNAP family protein [Paracoccus zhejiangensis]|uniref:NIPSNAP family protein n=1 Tax=Paracoccus zhejiangensis TaxID=1077935 RepID=A0A2H5F0W3_9RHOB|nr:NIPSNAP family protein [Paracoccus zhejiangensis]AUH65199.1 NIPSNAP family protein [Paracoccus zhejiangensis]